jgi:hypothetical protein
MKPSEFIDLLSTSALQIDEDINLSNSAVKAIDDQQLKQFVQSGLEMYNSNELENILASVRERIEITKPNYKKTGKKELDQGGKRFTSTDDEELDEMIHRLNFIQLSQFEAAISAFIRIKTLLGNA